MSEDCTVNVEPEANGADDLEAIRVSASIEALASRRGLRIRRGTDESLADYRQRALEALAAAVDARCGISDPAVFGMMAQ